MSALTATAPSATKTIAPEDAPKFWFMESVHDPRKAYPRARFLPNQWVPIKKDEDQYALSRGDWNTTCDQDIRKDLPVGTIFVAVEAEHYKNNYGIPSRKIYPIIDDPKGYTPATKEMRDAYHAYLDLTEITTGAPPLASQEETPTPAKGSSLLGGLYLDKTFAPPEAKDGFHIEKTLWYLLLRNVMIKKNTLLVGPTGTGKTAMMKRLGQRLAMSVEIVNMGAMHDPILGLLGGHRFENGESVFDYARFTEIIQKPGIVVMDEINRPLSCCNNILFPMLDEQRVLPVEIAAGKGVRSIPVHKDCVFIGLANLGLEYTGTNRLDPALVSRFFMAEVDYLPLDAETQVLVARTGIKHADAKNIATVAAKIRKKAKQGELSISVSPRETLDAAEMVRDGFDVPTALQLVMLPIFEDAQEDGERYLVKTMLMTR